MSSGGRAKGSGGHAASLAGVYAPGAGGGVGLFLTTWDPASPCEQQRGQSPSGVSRGWDRPRGRQRGVVALPDLIDRVPESVSRVLGVHKALSLGRHPETVRHLS